MVHAPGARRSLPASLARHPDRVPGVRVRRRPRRRPHRNFAPELVRQPKRLLVNNRVRLKPHRTRRRRGGRVHYRVAHAGARHHLAHPPVAKLGLNPGHRITERLGKGEINGGAPPKHGAVPRIRGAVVHVVLRRTCKPALGSPAHIVHCETRKLRSRRQRERAQPVGPRLSHVRPRATAPAPSL